MPHVPALVRVASVGALIWLLAACTPGGQFDPTSIFDTDMFNSKTKLKGDRQPVFPNGVPGTTAGVPPELMKGYQPPPEQAADNNPAPDAAGGAAPTTTGATTAAAAPEEKPKPKPKPKPKIARAPASTPTHISVGPKPSSAAPSDGSQQSGWPNSGPPTQQMSAPAQQQSVWPNPPATSTQ